MDVEERNNTSSIVLCLCALLVDGSLRCCEKVEFGGKQMSNFGSVTAEISSTCSLWIGLAAAAA